MAIEENLNIEERRLKLQHEIYNLNKRINELQRARLKTGEDITAEEKKLISQLNNTLNSEKEVTSKLESQTKWRKLHVDLAKSLGNQLKLGWKYLQEQDKVIKTTTLNLGLSGVKAEMMRGSFEKSAIFVARLGGSLVDVQAIMQGFADETGRAHVLTADMVKDVTLIARGTGLGIEQGTKLAAQFEYMGVDTRRTMEHVQNTVTETERMGLNTTKVLKNVSDNFKKLNTYTFRQGVKGFAEMSMYAEKFRLDITSALNAADVARTLEGAIDLAAQLQVMGGEFAKTDPFEMLFLSRNDPAKFQEKIGDMTKGVVTFRKVTDSAGKTVFEKFISPADRDRMAQVAKTMGIELGTMTELAQRQAEIQKIRQEMGGLGLSAEQKQLIEGAAKFDSESGKFQVSVGDSLVSIGNLTREQAKSFQLEQKTLEERAKDAMTFDESFKATVEILKSSLLPLLKNINSIAEVTIKPLADLATKGWGGLATAAGILLTAGVAWKGIAYGLDSAGKNWIASGNIFKKTAAEGAGGGGFRRSIGNIFGGKGRATDVGGEILGQGQGVERGALAKGQGMKSLGKGVGAGAAMAGAGAGISIAAKGISELADSMSKLTPEQAKSLSSIATTMAITFPAAAFGIAAVGGVAKGAALGLLALGGSMLMIGGGIALATMGIGQMGEGLAKLNESGGGAGKELLGVAGGVLAITSAMSIGGGVISMFAFNKSLERMNKNSGGIKIIGDAFASIQAVLSGTKEDFIAVENAINSIGNANIKGGGLFTELTNLLSKPLKVEFANKEVSMVNNITLDIDGHQLLKKSLKSESIVQAHDSLSKGYGSGEFKA